MRDCINSSRAPAGRDMTNPSLDQLAQDVDQMEAAVARKRHQLQEAQAAQLLEQECVHVLCWRTD